MNLLYEFCSYIASTLSPKLFLIPPPSLSLFIRCFTPATSINHLSIYLIYLSINISIYSATYLSICSSSFCRYCFLSALWTLSLSLASCFSALTKWRAYHDSYRTPFCICFRDLCISQMCLVPTMCLFFHTTHLFYTNICLASTWAVRISDVQPNSVWNYLFEVFIVTWLVHECHQICMWKLLKYT